jgi:TonB family protein
VQPPEVTNRVDAAYPPAELAARHEAVVVLLVTVAADGAVSDVEVAESGGTAFDQAAIEAARRWRFNPALQAGKALASRIRVPFRFTLPPLAERVTVFPVPQPPPAPEPAPNPAERKEGILSATVVGRAPPRSRGTSDFQINVETLAAVPHKNATELLRLAPGILLTNEGGEGHAEQIFLRGFDAREGQDVEFSVGGAPINESGNYHGNGYADLHFIIPEVVEGLRVLEGPFDPRQGNYAVGGSADYQLGLTDRGLGLRYTNGSFNTQRMLVLWGPEGESRHTFAAADLHHTDGFGQDRDADSASAMTQYEGAIGEAGSFRLLATAYATNYHSPGVIREDDYEAGRIGFYDSYDRLLHAATLQGGDASRFALTGDFEKRSGSLTYSSQAFLTVRDMRLLENFTGFLLDSQDPIQTLHGQRGDLLDLDVGETTFGARGFARTQGELFGRAQELEAGYFARGDRVSSKQSRIEAATGHPYRIEADLDAVLGDIGVYGDLNLKLLRWLTLRGGVRADLFTYDITDNCAVQSVSHPSKSNPPGDASCLDQENMGQHREPFQHVSTSSSVLMPRVTLLAGPWHELTFSASYGEGVRSIDPSYVTQDAKTPFASIAAYEAGLGWTHTLPRGVQAAIRSAFFQTHVDHDLIFNETEGRNTLANGTTRTGVVGAARLRGRFFDQALNATWVQSTFDDTGLLVPYVPDLVVRSDTGLFGPLPLRIRGDRLQGTGGLGITYVGRRALPFGERSDSIFTVDGSLDVAWRNVDVAVSALNLLDRQYRLGEYNFTSDFHSQPAPTLVPVRTFTAGAPRTVLFTVGVRLGGSR